MFIKILTFFFSIQLLQASMISEVIDSKKHNGEGQTVISFEEVYNEVPTYQMIGNDLVLSLPISDLSAKAVVDFSGNIKRDQNMTKLLIPNVDGKNIGKVQLKLDAKKISVHYPVSVTAAKEVIKAKPAAPIAASATAVKGKEELNEEYLNYLIESVKKDQTHEAAKAVVETKEANEDKVTTKNSAAVDPAKEVKKESGISLGAYGLKFGLALLGLITIFIALAHIFKKVVLNRGKLSFLKGNKVVEVLATTHIAPKRSLMLIRVHEQIILVANAENGIQMLTEVSDPTGLLKFGEKLLTGKNFDTEVDRNSADDNLDSKIKMKDLSKLDQSDSATKVKFSDQVKKKVKTLKSFQ